MRLILHELKTELVHHRGLIVLWWLTVFTLLGYDLRWWWQEPQELGYQTGDEIHSVIREALDFSIWMGLALFPILLFRRISPDRVGGYARTWPLSDRDRIVTAVLFLVLAVGLPWWIHEWVFLRSSAGFSVGNALAGVVERFAMCGIFWTAFAIIGWCSRSKWIAVAVGFGIHLLFLEFINLAEWFPKWASLESIFEGSHQVFAQESPLIWFIPLVVPALGWLLGWFWRTKGNGSVWKQWVPFASFCVLSIPIANGVEVLLRNVVMNVATDEDQLAEIAEVEQLSYDPAPARYTRYESIDGEGSDVRPAWKWAFKSEGLPRYVGPSSSLIGGYWEWGKEDGSQVKFAHTTLTGRSETDLVSHYWLPALVERIREKAGKLPIIFGTNEGLAQAEELYGDVEDSKSAPSELPIRAVVDGEMEYLRFGQWKELPLDGKWHDLDSLGRSRFVKWGRHGERPLLRIWCHPYRRFSDWRNGVKPEYRFALWHEKEGEWVLLPTNGNSFYPNAGGFGAAPQCAADLFVDFPRFRFTGPDAIEKQDAWLNNAKLMVIEGKFVGTRRFELAEETIPDSDSAYFPMHTPLPLARYWTNQEVAEKRSEWETIPEGMTEMEFRRWMYEMARVVNFRGIPLPSQKEKKGRPGLVIREFPEEYRPWLRDVIQAYPELEPVFGFSWNEEDKDWLIDTLGTRKNWVISNWHFANNAAKRGWLDDNPERLRKIVTLYSSNQSGVPLAVVEKAKQHGIDGMSEISFRSQLQRELWDLEKQVSLTQKEKFPEIWSELESSSRVRWESIRPGLALSATSLYQYSPDQWQFGINISRLTGDPAPLREIVATVEQGALRHPGEDAYRGGTLVTRDLWIYLCRLFQQPTEMETIPRKEREPTAARWLAAEWKFDPKTLTYQIIKS